MGLVLVSHSGTLVEGLRDMVAQVAGDDVPVATPVGPRTGAWARARRASRRPSGPTLDAGPTASSSCSTSAARAQPRAGLEELDPRPTAARVRVSEAPLVEGAILAAVQASVGASLDEVAAAAGRLDGEAAAMTARAEMAEP